MLSKGITVLRSAVYAFRQASASQAANAAGGASGHRAIHSARSLQIPQNVLQNVVSRIFSGAAVKAPIPSHIPFAATRQARSISSGLSLHAKASLSRQSPLLHARFGGAQFTPRAPNFASTRSVANVGLGTARNFSSGAGKPLFQNLVHNVPVSLRAFSQLDVDLDAKNRASVMMQKRQSEASQPRSSMFSPKTVAPLCANSIEDVLSEMEEVVSESEVVNGIYHYFVTSAEASNVPTEAYTTYLTIPLSPPEEHIGRTPLPFRDFESLMLTGEALSTHNVFNQHSRKVSELFQRLDNAEVWTKNVSCEALTIDVGASGSGQARALRVTFEGWRGHAVESVVGHGIHDWCSLKESSTRTGLSSQCSIIPLAPETPSLGPQSEYDFDPSTNLIMPSIVLENHDRTVAGIQEGYESDPSHWDHIGFSSYSASESDHYEEDVFSLTSDLGETDFYSDSDEDVVPSLRGEANQWWTDTPSEWASETDSRSTADLNRLAETYYG